RTPHDRPGGADHAADSPLSCATPRLASIWAHSDSSVPSSPHRPVSITPIGSPPADRYSGSVTLGRPVRFASAANGENAFIRANVSAGPTPSVNQPIGGGGCAIVG